MRTVEYTYLRVVSDPTSELPAGCGRARDIRLILLDGYPCLAGQHAAQITLIPSQARELADTLLELAAPTEHDRRRP